MNALVRIGESLRRRDRDATVSYNILTNSSRLDAEFGAEEISQKVILCSRSSRSRDSSQVEIGLAY